MLCRSAVCWLTLVLLPSLADALEAQSATPACPDSVGRTMAFLAGRWEGDSYSIAGHDTTLDAVMKVRSERLFGACALEERWEAIKDGKVLFAAKVIRAYDAPTQRWSVYYVDNQLNSQIYEGRWEARQWRFHRTRLDRGTPIQVRLTWRPTKVGYEQLIERSRDGGATWTLGGLVRFRPQSAAGNP